MTGKSIFPFFRKGIVFRAGRSFDNGDIRSQVPKTAEFIYKQLDRVGLAHTTFSEAAVNLAGRSSVRVLQCVQNLCVGGLIEALRNQVRVVDTKQINAVLMQPHWRHHRENEKHEGVSFSKEKPNYGPGGF